MPNPYSVLGIRPTASPDEVKAAFRKMAMRYHPDRTGGDEVAAQRMAEVNAAYDHLRAKEAETDDGPPNPTTYLRLLTEREHACLTNRADKIIKTAQRRRKLQRLKAPFSRLEDEPQLLLLSAIHIEDDGMRLHFKGLPTRPEDRLLLPAIRSLGAGQVQVEPTDIQDIPAPACPARATTIYIKDAERFVADFDGILHLKFDV